jgi:glucuronokinase
MERDHGRDGSPERGRGVASARAALAGNPSDGYAGAVLAVTLPQWCAQAEAAMAPEVEIEPANALVEAAVRRFARELGTPGAAVRWSTSIPQRVGLGSSSALVIAVIRSLGELHGVELPPDDLAALALAVEVEDMGIAAGLQDRVVQAYGGLVLMDFAPGASGGRHERLDAALLPPLVIAWRDDAAATSGDVHDSLRERHRRGDALVAETMAKLGEAAREAHDALVAGQLERFGCFVDRTFDLRRRMLELDPRCIEMVELARASGASANYTGSGGAIVAVCWDDRHREAVAEALRSADCEVALPGMGHRPPNPPG